MEYLYHETNKHTLMDIVTDGLIPMSYGQSFVGDMGEMLTPDDFSQEELQQIPKQDKIVRTYIHINEPNRFNYGDVLLRFPAILGGKLYKDVDHYITSTIPPEFIEVKIDGNWIDISS